eukprot:gnl/TRDRNA2_/TRDRNA2_83362_c0_seq2.p1 gnl/TRDRNA2_/TRDRNA2_83362_c0~~gnl/TRDRNA2_/TRDRNA2_83362_c0_seq2.p1  ORF type:complete len:236 (-),score=44.45 gnl/TRDRNA2_/TRDRNA2_83362_c0_seq2:45-752(-)
MSQGDKYVLYIPPWLAFGVKGASRFGMEPLTREVPPGGALIVEVEMIELPGVDVQRKPKQGSMSPCPKTGLEPSRKWLEENGKNPAVTTLPTGVQYKEVQAGTGKVKVGERATFTLSLNNILGGTILNRKDFAKFEVKKLPPALREVLPRMVEGDVWVVACPSSRTFDTFLDSSTLTMEEGQGWSSRFSNLGADIFFSGIRRGQAMIAEIKITKVHDDDADGFESEGASEGKHEL